MNSVSGCCQVLSVVDDEVVHSNRVDGNLSLASIVLLRTSQETMGEIEEVDSEYFGDCSINPGLEELKALFEVLDIRTEWLQGRIADSLPHSRNLRVNQRPEGFFKLSGQEHLTLDGSLQVLE